MDSYLKATSQKVKLIIIARKITVLVKEITIAFPSYFKCIKNSSTTVDLMDATKSAMGTLKNPKST